MSGMEAPAHTCYGARFDGAPSHIAERECPACTPADPSCNFCGKPTALTAHGRYVEHQGITTRGICCGTALLHVPGRKVARR